MSKQLRAAIHRAIDALQAVKTYAFFQRVLSRDVRALYADRITRAEFVDGLADLLEQQMRRAWNEGMRANGRDPARDMTDEWESIFQELVVEQFALVEQFADAIVNGRLAELGVRPVCCPCRFVGKQLHKHGKHLDTCYRLRRCGLCLAIGQD
jgi:hypothetical protein